LQTVQNLLEVLLNSGIPVKKASLQKSDFVQQNLANYKLTATKTSQKKAIAWKKETKSKGVRKKKA
jgi:hypothetical protein